IRIVELAGVEEPETAADAPEWIRQPAAYLTFNALVPRMRSPELITWAAERARAAEAQLKGRRGSTRSSGSGASVGEIKHIPHW
ncbi:MAG TPA: hypothetical protein VHI13_18950, partial [Candidatus Kapabacteria bacterium]|nr:hypothetical protein [Candidatus Kapabacteria bacterium]